MSTPIITAPEPLSTKKRIFWIITVLLPLIILLLPTSELFTYPIKAFFALTLCAILMFAFELMDNFIPALLLPVGYVLFKVVPATVAYAAWTSNMAWMMLGALLLVNVVERAGLLKRGAYWIIIRTGSAYWGVLFGLAFAGIVLNLMLPGQVFVPLIVLGYGICLALDLGRSKTAVGIMLAAAIGSSMPLSFIFAPNGFGVNLSAANAVDPTLTVGFIQYFLQNLIFLPLIFIMVFIIGKLFKPDIVFQGKEYFNTEYKNLGKMEPIERKSALIVILLIIYLLTDSLHHLGMAWGFVLAGCAMFFPGINIGTVDDIKQINISLVLFVLSCLSIGQVCSALGIGNIISQLLLPYLQGVGTIGLVTTIWLVTVILNFLMTPLAIIATFAGPTVQIAQDLGMDPLPLLYTIQNGCDQVLLPYEYFTYLFVFSFGIISTPDFMKFFGIKMVLSLIYLLVLAVPYWMLLGLL